MKTQLAMFPNGSRTCPPRTRLLWAAVLALPVLGAQAGAVLTSLYLFQVSPNGVTPFGGLVEGSDGNFYGTTSGGGTNNSGTAFKISPNGALTSLYSFTGGNDGASPGGLVQGNDGYFYGTTSVGGPGGGGTVFRLTMVPDPQLTIIPSAASFVLTWPTNYAGFILQSATNLGSPAWTTNSPAPVVVNGQNTVTNPIAGTQQFFRLRQ
jgi:uncharacterized repeat protein (TIGR03803 family)